MNNATKKTVSTFGAIMALAGVEHGIGEIFQGNVAPDGIVILSWPEAEFFRGLGGEPAMTVIPNLRFTGILAVLVSLALLVWSVRFVHRQNGALIMGLLSAVLLLVGGGIFPPIFAILMAAVATRIHSPMTWRRAHRSNGFRRILVKLWPWSYAACIIAWISAFPAGYFLGESHPVLLIGILFFSLGTQILTVVSGFARDLHMQASARSTTQDTDLLNQRSRAKKQAYI